MVFFHDLLGRHPELSFNQLQLQLHAQARFKPLLLLKRTHNLSLLTATVGCGHHRA